MSDIKNSFPQPTVEFHEKLCSTLENLEEKEQIKMKTFKFKKTFAIAAAIAVLAVGTAGIASQIYNRSRVSHSSIIPTYTEIPTENELKKDIGITPKIVGEFSNGYVFDNASKVKNEIKDIVDENTSVAVLDENGKKVKFNSITLHYRKGNDTINISAQPAKYSSDEMTETENYNGIGIKYSEQTYKFLPTNYEMTEQDKKDEAEGKYVFSYGSDEVEIAVFKGALWEQDGIVYNMFGMDTDLSEQEILTMAKEVIDF